MMVQPSEGYIPTKPLELLQARLEECGGGIGEQCISVALVGFSFLGQTDLCCRSPSITPLGISEVCFPI